MDGQQTGQLLSAALNKAIEKDEPEELLKAINEIREVLERSGGGWRRAAPQR